MKVAVAVASVVAALGAVAPALAAPSPTPNGWVGACNMNSSWPGLGHSNGVGVQPGGGMERAMTVDNPNGNAGMFRAVERSGDQDC
jgi:hypothetical protein